MSDTTKLRRVAEQLTSIFENGTTELQYAYAENLNDGRGITCGRTGFCTGTGDAFEVVKRYCLRRSANPLSVFLPELRRLTSAQDSSETKGLAGFEASWRECASDAEFRNVQDEVTNELYWVPSQRQADRLGLETNLSRAFIFDTIIQHGDDGDADSLGALLQKTCNVFGGAPSDGVDEREWLSGFIKVRGANLANCNDEASRKEWAGSVGRCDTFRRIAESGNFSLATPFDVEWESELYSIK
jgi:chitosanase